MNTNFHNSMANEVLIPGAYAGEASQKIFVGSLSAAESSSFIHDHRIDHVLTVARLSVAIPENCNVNHKVVECIDHPLASILEVLPECFHFIKSALGASGNILVHCASGVSRSVSICAAFLMIEYKMEMKSALNSIAAVRKYANPNLGFKRQLEVLERCKGDVKMAQQIYSAETANVVEDTMRQRDAVNKIHREVDDVEDKIASMKSRGEENCTGVEDTLMQLHRDLHSCLPPSDGGFVDPPARMMQKAAITKVERLINSLK